MLIKSKFEGYSKDGIRLYPCDDGGGEPSQQTQTQIQDLPDWALPYAKEVLGKGAKLGPPTYDASGKLISGTPYEAYTKERIAKFDPLQEKSFEGARNMQSPAAMGQGIDAANTATNRALSTSYDPTQFNAQQVQAQGLNQYQMGPAERISTQSFAQPGAADSYMSPYMQNVVAMQQREAMRASDMLRNQNQAQAVGQGAFGGSRQAIVEAERQRNLGTQLGDIQAAGSQAAYQQAQQQFNAEQAARLQAQQANQGAGLTVGQQNLAANLGIQQLGAGQNMQAQLANQQQGLEAQRLAEQSRQYGANLGLQGLQTALTGAGQLGALGQQQFGQGMDINKLQNLYGAQRQQRDQSDLSQKYQDFLDEKKLPYQQLEFQSNLLRGTPSGSTQTMYTAQPSMGAQLVGAGTALYGASKLAKGGRVSDAKIKKKKSAGLAELALSKI
jgi:hypothetical protein